MKVEKIDDACKTKYPVVLVHGLGFRDGSRLYNYWGRIPNMLAGHGAVIYYGGQDSWGTMKHNAEQLKKKFEAIIETDHVEKLNVIAHSKGGMDVRFLISNMGMEKYISSVTTIATPHNGMHCVDALYKVPKCILSVIAFFVNLNNKIAGDSKPDFYHSLQEITTYNAKSFNEQCKNKETIVYQSYAGKMKNIFSDLLYIFTYPLVYLFDGDNDGLVSVESAKWGNFKGLIENRKLRGISHSDEVDLWRMNLSKFDIRSIYFNILKDLKEKGL